MHKDMIKAAKTGDVAKVRELLQADPTLAHAAEADGSTPLHFAAWKGHPEVAELLIDAGANINAENQNTHWGTTPLHAAAHANNTALVKFLIARGAAIDAPDSFGKTPLQHTAYHGAKAAAKVLVENGATGL